MIYSREMLRRVEAVTSSLRGVVRSRLETEDGVLRKVRIVVTPEKDPGRAASEVRSALLSSLGVEVDMDEIEVDVDVDGPRLHGIEQERFWRGPGKYGEGSRAPEGAEEPSSPRATPGNGGPELGSRGGDRGDERQARSPGDEGQERERRSVAMRREARRGEERRRGDRREDDRRSAAGSIRLKEFGLLGGRGPGIELRVRIEAEGGGTYEGRVDLAGLDAIAPRSFAEGALRASEELLDALPGDRRRRILLLEAADVEEVELRDGTFVAVTVRARLRDAQRESTGFAPVEGEVGPAAARAALDAVRRLLEGEGHGRPGTGGEAEDRSPGSGAGSPDPFQVWD